jgi:putative flippase GtrA
MVIDVLERLRWWPPADKRARFARYAAGSVLATAVSAIVFAVGYRWLGLGPRLCSVAAFASGALVNFFASRFWAWGRRKLPGLGRDMLSYTAIALTTAALAAGITTLAERFAERIGASENSRTALVEVGYFSAYAVMFLVKFVVLDRFVFTPRRSR